MSMIERGEENEVINGTWSLWLIGLVRGCRAAWLASWGAAVRRGHRGSAPAPMCCSSRGARDLRDRRASLCSAAGCQLHSLTPAPLPARGCGALSALCTAPPLPSGAAASPSPAAAIGYSSWRGCQPEATAMAADQCRSTSVQRQGAKLIRGNSSTLFLRATRGTQPIQKLNSAQVLRHRSVSWARGHANTTATRTKCPRQTNVPPQVHGLAD
jgi:hypothetical protein